MTVRETSKQTKILLNYSLNEVIVPHSTLPDCLKFQKSTADNHLNTRVRSVPDSFHKCVIPRIKVNRKSAVYEIA